MAPPVKPDPYASYLPKDWGSASAGDVARSLAANIVPSAKRAAIATVEPLLPKNWGRDWEAAKQLAAGIGSKTHLYRSDNPAVQAKDEALLDAIGQHYKQRYGTKAGFKEGLATDPVGMLMDVGALASIPAGGEGLMSRVPGAMGETLAKTASTASKIANATNPVWLGAKAVGKTAGALRGPRILDAAGNIAAPIAAKIVAAFPQGTISAADLNNPAFKTAAVDVLRKKGVTPASIKEAALVAHNAPAPRSVVSGTVVPREAAGTARDLVGQGHEALAAHAASISGAAAPDTTQLGDMLQQAYMDSHNGYAAQYAKAFNQPGAFEPGFTDILRDNVEAALKKDNLPSSESEFHMFPSHKRSGEAFNWLTNHSDILAMDPGELNGPNLERMRQELGAFGQQAKSGTERRAIGAMTSALDNSIIEAANKGLFVGGDGAQMANDMQTAREMFKQHKETFHDTSTPTDTAVSSAVRNFADEMPRDPTNTIITGFAPVGSSEKAQDVLTKNLVDSKTLAVKPGAIKLYNKVGDAVGDTSALDQHLRELLTQSARDDTTGITRLKAKPEAIHSFLDSDLGQVFSKPEQSDMRLLAENKRVLDAKPLSADTETNWLQGTPGKLGRLAAGAILGHGVGSYLFDLPDSGAILGVLGESGVEGRLGNKKAALEATGAAPSTGVLGAVERAGNSTANARATKIIPPMYGLGKAGDTYDQQTPADDSFEITPTTVEQPSDHVFAPPAEVPAAAKPEADPYAAYVTDQRPQRKAGGRVGGDVERLVKSLMDKARNSKKLSDKGTEVLLKVDDSTIAKALHVAQKARV